MADIYKRTKEGLERRRIADKFKKRRDRKNDPDRIKQYDRAADLKHKFGMTIDQYNKLFEEQEGCCGICGRHQSELKYRLCVDHNHKTGIIRGLLCVKCNTALGSFNDTIELLEAAIEYLIK